VTRELEGKTALVTGASRGLGAGIAKRLAESGALVAVHYSLGKKGADETLAEIEAKGGKGFLLQQDLTEAVAAKALASSLEAELVKRTGKPDLNILVNNIGGGGRGDNNHNYQTISNTTPEIFDYIVMLNLRIPFFVTQALMDRIPAGGRVINISSAASRLAGQDFIVYSMCKSGLDTFTYIMAKNLGPKGITVNSVLPGFNATEGNLKEKNDPVIGKAVEDMTLLGRWGQADDIANVVHAVASPAMSWVTAQCIEASGGFRLL
jgi:NAD(P)-dependent dehydrogenase (short-subunit alcohol dehydrogenase family)